MKKLVILAIACTALLSCTHTPPRGGDPVDRDSIGDSLYPVDTTAHRLQPDTLRDTTRPSF